MSSFLSPHLSGQVQEIFSRSNDKVLQQIGQQNYPLSTLFIIATPIGNIADITLRALYLLIVCDVIACEDTRVTKQLLQLYGIDHNKYKWLSCHAHNESRAANEIVQYLQNGSRVAYVSDAGTPGISDPGAYITAKVRAAGFTVSPIPGASALTALLSVSENCAVPICFLGFLPATTMQRRHQLERYRDYQGTLVLYEAPHRIHGLIADLMGVFPADTKVVIGRELTKQFETIYQNSLANLAASSHEQLPARGEYTLVLHLMPVVERVQSSGEKLLLHLARELPLKQAVRLAAEISGERKNKLYDYALLQKVNNERGQAGEINTTEGNTAAGVD